MTETAANNLVARTWTRPLQRPKVIPDAADVVIGGGIIGVSTAWFLAKQGVDVVLCEKGHIAGDQSGRNWGWVRQQGRDTREMPMIVESLRIWRGLEEEIGADVGITEGGVLFAASSDEQMNGYAEWIETAAGRVSAVVTEHGVTRTGVVLCAAGALTSMLCGSMGIIVPQLKVRGTVARTAPTSSVLDGNLFDNRLAIRRRQDGGYTLAPGMLLEHPITPSSFRFAAKFLPAARLEYKNFRLSFGREFIDELMAPASWTLDAESPFERCRVLDPEPAQRALKIMRRNLDSLFPQLSGIEFVESWGA